MEVDVYMKAVIREPNKPAKLIEINSGSTVSEFQRLVGGYVEYVPIGNHAACLVDEGGWIKGLDYCCTVQLVSGRSIRLYGTVLFLGIEVDGFSNVPSWVIRKYGGK